jgi:hypothetical protein
MADGDIFCSSAVADCYVVESLHKGSQLPEHLQSCPPALASSCLETLLERSMGMRLRVFAKR